MWRKAAGAGGGIADNSCIGFFAFAASAAVRIAASGLYYYYIYGLDIPYTDEDDRDEKVDPLAPSGRIHLGLQPTSGTKSAGASGAVKITLFVDPTHG